MRLCNDIWTVACRIYCGDALAATIACDGRDGGAGAKAPNPMIATVLVVGPLLRDFAPMLW